MIEQLLFLKIAVEAQRQSGIKPGEDDYKDAIVEICADIMHLTDEEIDFIYKAFLDFKNQGQVLDFMLGILR